MHGSDPGFAKNLHLCLVALLTLSPSWDGGLQIVAGVVTASLISMIITEYFDDGYRLHRFVVFCSSIVFVGIFLIILGAVFYPLTGFWATFLHWHAIIVCLVVLSTIIVSRYARPEAKEDDATWILIIAIAADMLVIFVLWLLGLH